MPTDVGRPRPFTHWCYVDMSHITSCSNCENSQLQQNGDRAICTWHVGNQEVLNCGRSDGVLDECRQIHSVITKYPVYIVYLLNIH